MQILIFLLLRKVRHVRKLQIRGFSDQTVCFFPERLGMKAKKGKYFTATDHDNSFSKSEGLGMIEP